MANKLKSKREPKVNEEALNPDSETSLNVTDVVKDERTSKIAGIAILLLTIFLFIAFTSYFFTWQDDQDKLQIWRKLLFSSTEVKMNNQVGYFGAFIAYQMVYNGFGLAAYLFCAFTFVLGINLFFTKPIFNIWRNIKYVLIGLLVLSTSLAFVTKGASFSWGGAMGEYTSSWMVKFIGSFGTGALLVVGCFSYFVWRVNPKFNVPNFNFLMPKQKEVPFMSEKEGIYAPDAEAIRKEWDLNNPQPQETPAEELPSGNRLKNYATAENGISVIMPEEEDSLEASDDLGSDHDGGKLFIDELAPTLVVEDLAPDFTDLDDELLEDLDLEVNEGVKEEIVTAAAIGSLATKFDATLDLKNYKYPSINLLETHGSEKIVQDPEELETHKNQIIATLKNYDIAIQRIAATVGPTVTLYEIVPAPGVRISRIGPFLAD